LLAELLAAVCGLKNVSWLNHQKGKVVVAGKPFFVPEGHGDQVNFYKQN